MTSSTQVGFVDLQIDVDSAWWWDELRAGRFMLPRCTNCGRATFPPTPSCPYCGAESFVHEEASGSGIVYSWIVVHIALDPKFADEVPYTVLAVQLDEGPRIFARLVGDDEGLAADAPVRAAPYEVAGETMLGFELVRD